MNFKINDKSSATLATVIAALLWSTGGLLVVLLPQNAFTILFYRSAFTVLTLLFILKRDAFNINKLTILGACFYAPLVISFVTSTKMVGAATAIFLQYAAPAYILLLEPFLFKTKLKRLDIFTVILCMIGLSVFFYDQFESPKNWLGALIAFAGGFLWAGLVLSQSRNTASHQGSTIFWGNLLVVIITLPWFFSSPYPTTIEFSYLAFLGIVQLGLGFYLFTIAQRYISTVDSSLIAMLEPLLNPVWVLLGTGIVPSRLSLIGGAIILGALVYRLVKMRLNMLKS